MTDNRNVLLQRPKAKGFGGADASLAALVISVVGLMIIPLPTWLLDLLIASNLALAVTVLLVTLYVTDALKVAAFPSLLLITTLVRLALNVSSTRLILLQADAGDMISAFGSFVVRGNYVVGAVIFLILTIIQFVVIAKGSERVAEVGARFTLDAMPGKQMSIDAELRAGNIDSKEAKRKRHELSRESQFYGAMDGAMKFVKGDTIASFLITIINILGGIAIGVGQRDMAAVEALKKFGLLTIGDGLVSQIPALVLSTAAGILVTRVASEEHGTALGAELSSQLLRTPKALAVAGGFVAALGFVPGLPAIPLLLIGGGLLFASRARRKTDVGDHEPTTADPVPKASSPASSQKFIPVVVPWSIEVSADLESLLEDETRGDKLLCPGVRSVGPAVREIVFRELGIPLPAPVVRLGSNLPQRHAVLNLHEVPTQFMNIPDEVPDDGIAPFILDRALFVMKSRAGDYLGIAETQNLLDQLEQVAPATVRQVVPKPVSLTLLTEVLRRLTEEAVSIRDLKTILEALAQVAQADKDPLNLTEYVRSQMRRALTYEVTGGAPELAVVLVGEEIEETVRGAVSRTSGGSFLTLSPAMARDVVRAATRAMQQAQDAGIQGVVLLTQADVRRFIRKLVEKDLPNTKVMSFNELMPEIAIKTVAQATVRNLG